MVDGRNISIRMCSILGVLSLLLTQAPSVRSEEFRSNGVRIHYVDEGAGPPVLLIHGFGASLETNWRLPGTIDILKRNGFRVIALDNRGHGRSDKPTRVEDYGLEMVGDAVRLLDHLGIEKADVVGYSMGGMIAMKLMSMHPERVNRVVVGGFGWLREGSRGAEFLARTTVMARTVSAAACRRSWPTLALSADQVSAISPPFLVLVGDDDRIVRREYVVPLLKVRPATRVQYVPGAGHIRCVAQDEFKRGIVTFLGGRATDAGASTIAPTAAPRERLLDRLRAR
jgi:pimeloyl-ACP methyl ester carboxylesterase